MGGWGLGLYFGGWEEGGGWGGMGWDGVVRG